MGQSTKTDNSHVEAKLSSRRHFLDKYHVGERPYVFDACQGRGLLWSQLRQTYDVRYWGVDLKAAPGRLKIDSGRILSQVGWTFDIIDIDTYGSPWKHYFAMLPRVTRPVTVFLTSGFIRMGAGGRIPNIALAAAGLCFAHLRPPISLLARAIGHITSVCLAAPLGSGLEIEYAAEAITDSPNVRYFGLRLSPHNISRNSLDKR